MKRVLQIGGTGGSADWNYFRNIGTALALGERWYIGNMVAGDIAGGNYVDDTLYAVPFLEVRGGTIDRIGFYNAGAVAGNARLGIYQATSNVNLYPNGLLLDCGAAAVGAGLNAMVINQALTPNTLYWLACIFSADQAVLYGMNYGGILTQLGCSNTFVPYTWGYIARAYGVMPAVFPAAMALQTDWPLCIGVRYSA